MRTPITTPELYRLLSLSIGKEKEATPYMVGKVFGVAHTTAGAWKRGHKVMDEANAKKAAEWLGLDSDFVILSLEAERKDNLGMSEIAAIFARAASAVANHGQAAAVAFLVLAALPYLAAAARPLCILCKTGCLPFEWPRSPRRRRHPSLSVIPAVSPAL